jgi:amino acid transporter
MASKGTFGTFGGVFTPSILTILGVIMYLRLPWLVGNAGLYLTLGIVAVAHVISICTGLSISSIATDKKVGAGGVYYIVSRSLGLPIGGTLGIAQFLGLAFSVSLYVIGFSESMLQVLGVEMTPTTIRICGSITLLLVTIVTLISTALAIKSQYLIMVLIGASLISIVLGSHASPPEATQLLPPEGGASFAVLFGVFFPAVTGFTAGVGMSGDLRDPKKSIPSGTMAAVAVGLVVYVALAWLLAAKLPTKALMDNPQAMLEFSAFPAAVTAGVWGATLSSALGSILGAPRVLQAMAVDRIGPRLFAKGVGATNEPRNALLLCFVLAEAGVLIAELDAIARIVSMVFLTSYAFLNISCAIESWVSPDFRPSFSIPPMVSVIGASACVLVMIQLDIVAMAGAIAFMVGLFLVLSRRQLTLDAGDAWEGVWSSLVRSGLWRLSREQRQQRNWRPNILLFRRAEAEWHPDLREFAASLISGNGILSELMLSDPSSSEKYDKSDREELTVGMFTKQIPTRDAYQSISDICRYRGFAGLEPNTVLIEWSTHAVDPPRFGELLDELSQLDHNILLYAPDDHPVEGEGRDRIDVWWSPGAGNTPLSLALVRFITGSAEYRNATVRFLIDNYDVSSNDQLRATLRGLLTGARVDGEIRVINRPPRGPSFEEKVAAESADALMTIVSLPLDPDQCGAEYLATLDVLVKPLHRVLIVRGSSAFEPVLTVTRPASISFLPPTSDGRPALPVIDVPQTAGIAEAVSKLAGSYQLLATSLFKGCLERLYAQQMKLLRDLRKATLDQFQGLDDGLNEANPRRQRKHVNRIQSTLLLRQRELLTAFADKALEQQRNVLEGRIESFLAEDTVVDQPPKEAITVVRDRKDFEPAKGDSVELLRVKARRGRFRWLFKGPVRYRVPVSRLKAFYFEKALKLMLGNAVRRFVTDSHRVLIQLGKQLGSHNLNLVLAEDHDDPADEGGLVAALREHEATIVDNLDLLIDGQKEELAKHQWELLAASRQLVQHFSDDVDRLDVAQLVKAQRRVNPKKARSRRNDLTDLPAEWLENQRLVLGRARLSLDLSEFQHRLTASVDRERASMLGTVRGGVLAECNKLHKALEQLLEQLDEESASEAKLKLSVHLEWSQRFDAEDAVETLVRGITDLAAELPQWVTTLTDESVQLLEEGGDEGADTAEVPVFRIAQFLVEARLLAGVQASVEEIPRLEQRAGAVAQDVMRLVSFQLNELEAPDDADDAHDAGHVKPAVVNGLERVQSEIEALNEAMQGVDDAFDKQLTVVIDGTNAYDLTGSAADLEQHIRRHRGERAVSGARHVLRRGSDTMKDAVANLLYRRSAGQLMAQKLRERTSHRGRVVDHVLSLVERHMPRDEVIEKLPTYYRQLFVGKATVNETFWVGRTEELAEAKRVLKSVGRGSRGAIVVTGERGSGKSSLLQRIVSEQLSGSQLLRLYAPRGGSISLSDFEEELSKAAGFEGTADEILSQLPDDAAIVLDDLELWWERSPDGGAVIDAILGLIERHSGRILFLLALSAQAYSFVNKLSPIEDAALAVIDCGPLAAVELEKIITLRHASTGLKYELDGKAEDELAKWHLAALFSRHFDFSRGWVGAALRSWITHVRKVSSSTLLVDAPSTQAWDVLDELRGELVALLLQLIIHKQLDRTRLARVSGAEPGALKSDIETLIRMGLLVESQQGMLTINSFIHHAVVERFTRRGLLS